MNALDINITDITPKGTGFITSKAMKCGFPSGNITRDTAALVSEYLDRSLAEEVEPMFPKPASKTVPVKPRRPSHSICEETAMEPRNSSLGYGVRRF